MRFKRRHLRRRQQLWTTAMEPLLSQWLERALADEQGRAFIRDRLARSVKKLKEIQY